MARVVLWFAVVVRLAVVVCLALIVCLSTLTGCKERSAAPSPAAQPVTSAPAVKAAPQTPLAEKKEELGSDVAWTPELDKFVEVNLPPELLSEQAARAVHSYCPAFAREPEADKRAFWAYTFQAIAAAEAGLQPTADVHHTAAAVAVKDKLTHRVSHQEGLLQLKYEDAQRYGCAFDFARDRRLPEKDPQRTILQPEVNLACGMKIMDDQIVTQGKPLVAHTSYWSTLQPGTVSYRVFAKQMANVPAGCELRVGRRR